MRPIRILLLSMIAPVLCALSLDDSEFDGGDALEQYVYNLTLHCDSQIEEIAALIPPKDVERLRHEHYSWKIQRDVHCAETARDSSDKLRELKCVLEATGEYFDRREAEIAEIEARQAQKAAQK